MSLAFRRTAALALASLLTVALFAPACSQQGEGERCDKAKTGNADCDDGLVCVKESELLDSSADRCCPSGNNFSDKRCTPKGPGGEQPPPEPSGGAAASDNGGSGSDAAPGGQPSGASSMGGNAAAGSPLTNGDAGTTSAAGQGGQGGGG